MVQQLLKYPDPRIRLISGNVRFFNDTLKQSIGDMIDTMKANDLDALSAIQIGLQQNIIVLKEDENYTPYINARFIKQEGKETQTERSPYYEGISVDVERYTSLTVVYEDEEGTPHSRDAKGEVARIFQHQLDYSYGSTFVDRVDRDMKKRIDEHLEFGLVKDAKGPDDSCPTVFYRDYFTAAIRWVIALTTLSILGGFFLNEAQCAQLFTYEMAALALVLLLIVGYAIVAKWETQKYSSCTSCQTGNAFGTIVIALWKVAIVAGLAYWLVKP